MVPDQTERIRALNDAFRKTFSGGTVLFTRGVLALPQADIAAITETVKAFADFSEENDPYGEHDFGSFVRSGEKIYWKIDYYDLALCWGSPDPADPAVTTRVLTVLLAEEY